MSSSAKKEKKFKFKSLKTYTASEWLVDKKKYRSVFINTDTNWIYGELAIYNILFDEEEWTCKIKFACYNITNGKNDKVFEYENEKTVTVEDNILYYRDGWGNKSKTYWKKGSFVWKAYVDGEFVGESKFYVEDEGMVTETENPYFDIQSVKLFSADSSEPAMKDRVYCKEFKEEDTAYLYTEFTLLNKISKDWHCELFFNYYNKNGQLKGTGIEYKKVSGNTETLCFGWGNNKKTSWKTGKYTVEIIFMDTLIAVIPFHVGNQVVEGVPEPGNGISHMLQTQNQEINDESLGELLEKLDTLIGLTEIKAQIRDYTNYLKFEKIRKEKGLKAQEKINLHTVLTGNPGTGKTTVAKQLGKIYKSMGLLTRGHVHEVDRADLVGEYIGQTAPRVKKEIEKARGGILFIDEAYALHREDSKNDYGQEVIEILLKEMSEGPGNLAVIAAGYPEEMNAFINSNPGLKSRFAHFFRFPDYIPDELMAIAELGLTQRELKMTDPAREFLFTKLTQAFRKRDKSFGNARYSMSLIDEGKMNMALRLVKQDDTETLAEDVLSTIQLEDVQKIFLQGKSKKLEIEIDTALLKDALNELNELIGLSNVKDEVQDLVKLVKYYHEIGKDVLNQFVLHTVFTGNPGTGKTTVARIYARIFKALGIIERGHLIECDREGLVAGYSGQTATKTSRVIDQAMGGVLFIDEAYALVQGNNDGFGMEAINTLLKRMEDNNKDFIMIAAGYPDNMNEFLRTNPGLKSRFEKTIHFEDYSPEELMEIAEIMFKKEDLVMEPSAKSKLQVHLQESFEARDKFFGNARVVRKIVQQAVRDHNLRMADMSKDQRTMDHITTITVEDFRKLDLSKPKVSGTRPIGF